jgi:mitochondrial chaperone BCS1
MRQTYSSEINVRRELTVETGRFTADAHRLGLGVPYHRGYLFYRPPRTGKTSLVSPLAARFGMSIYMFALGDFNDKSLMRAIQHIPTNSIILFEDIDCMRLARLGPM